MIRIRIAIMLYLLLPSSKSTDQTWIVVGMDDVCSKLGLQGRIASLVAFSSSSTVSAATIAIKFSNLLCY
ncbi:hypothetical protein SDJN03_03766, partial [Cucurbita argyrosperma subsp. sororia]